MLTQSPPTEINWLKPIEIGHILGALMILLEYWIHGFQFNFRFWHITYKICSIKKPDRALVSTKEMVHRHYGIKFKFWNVTEHLQLLWHKLICLFVSGASGSSGKRNSLMNRQSTIGRVKAELLWKWTQLCAWAKSKWWFRFINSAASY